MLPPLLIGDMAVADPVLLAPMAGVTDRPFRRLAKRFGAGLVYSEMLASGQVVKAHALTLKRGSASGDEGPLAVQIAGRDPSIMAEAARIAEGVGAALIDINMGCPAKKVVGGLAGSGLMRDETLAAQIMESVKAAVSVPVTVKMRLGWDEGCRNAPTLARIAEESGLAMITVHGRTRAQLYSGVADWSAIRLVREAIRLPLVVNGDIRTLADARTALAVTGANAVMIGRAAFGRPWVPGQIAAGLAGRTFVEPSIAERCNLLLEHYESLLEHHGAHMGVRIARKHVAWAAHGLVDATTFRDHFNRMEDPTEARTAITAFFATQPDIPPQREAA